MTSSSLRQVCVTGIGIVSPLGNTLDSFTRALQTGRSGIQVLSHQPPSRSLRVGGVVNIDFSEHLLPAKISILDRVSLLALVAANQAVQHANDHVSSPAALNQAGVYLGTGIGGVQALELAYAEHFLRDGKRIKPFTVVQAMNNASAGHIAMEFKCHGPSLTYSTACSSSAMAIGEAYRAIKHGYVDCVLAGGTEAMLIPGTIDAWDALRTLAIPDADDPAAACKPFSKNRTGLVLAEGAAVIVLEALEVAVKRGATIYALISGYGSQTDATHLTKPDADGQTATMQAALREAQLDPSEIDYVNAHGTATLAGDVVETIAIKQVFGKHALSRSLPVSSTKSMHGHVMGATGAVEFVAALCALRESFLPPTINLVELDPECDLDYVANTARMGVPLRHVMSNSFAFGGSNACLIASAS